MLNEVRVVFWVFPQLRALSICDMISCTHDKMIEQDKKGASMFGFEAMCIYIYYTNECIYLYMHISYTYTNKCIVFIHDTYIYHIAFFEIKDLPNKRDLT